MKKENQGASEMNPGNKKNSLKEVVADHDNTLREHQKRLEKLEENQNKIENNQNKILKHLGLSQGVKK